MTRDRSRTSMILLLLAALAIVAGTAATVLAVRSGAAPRPAEIRTEDGGRIQTRFVPPEKRAAETAPRTASLMVRVLRQADRSPVPGASVTLHSDGGESILGTNAKGEALFTGLAQGHTVVTARAPDLEPADRSFQLPPGAKEEVEILLADSAFIEGRVVAAADGSPIAGARVAALRSQPGRMRAGGRVLDVRPVPVEERAATTDAEGEFRLRAGSAGNLLPLQASAEGFAPESIVIAIAGEGPSPTRAEIRLERDGRIRGTVRDSRGKALGGAHVSAHPPPEAYPGRGPGGGLDAHWPTAVTGADGTYAIEGLAVGGMYRVQAYVPPPSGQRGSYRLPDGTIVLAGRIEGEGLSRSVDVFLAPDPGEAAADLVVPLWGTLAVAWRDASGRTDGPSRVQAVALDDPGARPDVLPVDGRAPGTVLHLREGRYRVVVCTELHGSGEAEAVVIAEGEARVEVVVGGSPSLAGVVVDGDGNPVPGAVVEAVRAVQEPRPVAVAPRWMPSRGPSASGPGAFIVVVSGHSPTAAVSAGDALPGAYFRARTDASGRFLLDGLADGSAWNLFVRGDLLAVPPTGPFEVPNADVRLVAVRSGAIEGVVVLPPGAAVPQTVSIHFASAEGDPPGTPSLRSTANWVRGRFSISALPPGPGSVWAAAGDLSSTPVQVVVPSGGTADADEVPLEAGQRVEGRIIDSRGAALEGCYVHAMIPGATVNATTDGEGRFALAGIPRGTLTFSVSHREQRAATLHRIEVPPADPVVIRLPGWGVLRGTARDSAGVPLAGWWVATRPAAAPDDPWTPRVPVGHRGTFEVTIDSGDWRVAVLAPGSSSPSGEADASVPEGGEASVDLRAAR